MPDKKKPTSLLGNYDTVIRQDKTTTVKKPIPAIGTPLKDENGDFITRMTEMKEYKKAVVKYPQAPPVVKQSTTSVATNPIVKNPELITRDDSPLNIKQEKKENKTANIIDDVGTQLLHAVNSFGGSVIGDAIALVDEDAAKAVSKYTGGVIPYTSQSIFEAHRGDNPDAWTNRQISSQNAVSSYLGGELIGAAVGQAIKHAPRAYGWLKNKADDVISNTYKINPYAFKPNPSSYYHRSPNIQNIINKETNTLQGFGESEAGRAYNSDAGPMSGRINLKKAANNQLYFSKGVPLDYGRYNKSGQGYIGPYMVEINNVPMGASTKGRKPSILPPSNVEGYAVSRRPISVDEAKFYKEHWLKGYKEIPKLKQSNFQSEIDWAKWNKEIPENKALMQEYNAIEQELKNNNQFGINPATNKPYNKPVPKNIDVVLRSKNFKKAFPNFNYDRDVIYRGERYIRKSYIDPNNTTNIVFGTDDLDAAKYFRKNYGEDIIHPDKIDEFLEQNPGLKENLPFYNQGEVGDINVLAIPNNSKTLRVNANNNDFIFLPDNQNLNREYVLNNTEDIKYRINRYGKDDLKLPIDYNEKSIYASTDNYASALNEGLKDYNQIKVDNVFDGINKSITVNMINPRNTPIKSIWYNNGMFDMTNPNIYKSVIPLLIGAGILKNKDK